MTTDFYAQCWIVLQKSDQFIQLHVRFFPKRRLVQVEKDIGEYNTMAVVIDGNHGNVDVINILVFGENQIEILREEGISGVVDIKYIFFVNRKWNCKFTTDFIGFGNNHFFTCLDVNQLKFPRKWFFSVNVKDDAF